MKRLFSLLVLTAFVAGCSTIEAYNPFRSSGPKMAELQPIQASVEVATAFRESLSNSGNYVFTPAIVGEAVFAAGGKGDVMRVEGTAVKWKVNVGMPLSGGVGADSRRVVVGSPKGDIIVLDAADGKEIWRARVTSEVIAAPALDAKIVIVRSGDNRLFGFDANDGKRLWVYQRQTPPLSLRTYAAPLIDNNYVFAGFPGGKLIAVTAHNGALAWEGTVAQPKGTTELDRVADITTSPVIANRLICAVAYQGRVACFDLASGNLAWSRDLSSSAGLTADARYVYVTDDKGAVHALDLASGASIWKQDKLLYRQVSAPAARGRLVAVGDAKGVVHLINRDDGSFVARLTTDGSPITAPIQVHDNRFIVQTRNGSLLGVETR